MRRASLAAGGLVALGAAALLHDAEAQRVDPRRPAVLVVGAPSGASPMQRVDARRSGLASTPLPSAPLRVGWRKATGLTFDQPALSGPDGSLALVSVRGDVLFLDAAGEERATIKIGASPVGPATVTADGTVVFTTASGKVLGVRSTGLRFAARIGGGRNLSAAPLALDDGGAAVATMRDLVVLDAEGNVRSRATLPESPSAPLLAWGGKIVAVGSTGAVFGWSPGREPVRLGSFGAPVDGGAALEGGALVAVIEDSHLAEVDLTRGGRTTRSVAAQGLFLGPPSIRSAAGGSIATVLALTPTRAFVLSLDPGGGERLRAPIASFTPQPLPDGGAPVLVAPPHVGTVVDERGAVAFAATDGHVGVVGADGVVDTVGEALCAKGTRSGIVGLTPSGAGAFVVTCDGGLVASIEGREPAP